MIYNNAEQLSSGLGSEVRNIVNFKFEHESAEEVLDKLSTKIQWADIASYIAIAKDLKTLEEDTVRSHYLFKSFPEEAVFRYAIVNIFKTKDGKVGVVFGQDTRKAFGIQQTTTFHDIKVSAFGLPFESSSVVHQVGTHRAEFHEYNRAQIMNALLASRATQSSGLGFDPVSAMAGATNCIKGVADAYGSIVSAFKTVKKTEFKEKIAGDGFDYYKSSNRFMRSLGIPNSKMKEFTTRVTNLMELNKYPDVQTKVADNMEIVALGVSEQTWSMNEMTFDKDKGGNCDSMIFAMSSEMLEDKSHLLLVYVKGSFKLSPHLMIWQNFKSVAGGIVETTKDVIKTEARGITTEEVKAVHACMVLAGLQVISDSLGLKIQLPPLEASINNA